MIYLLLYKKKYIKFIKKKILLFIIFYLKKSFKNIFFNI